MDIANDIDKFFSLYDKLKNHIRRENRPLYERWAAGGFLVDTDVMSMYPNISDALDELGDVEDVEQDATRENG